MSQARNDSITGQSQMQKAQLEELGYYHSIELPDGNVIRGFQSIENLRRRISQFPIPADLTGKRVLDIGAWDGWFTFEVERRGASVVALDLVRNDRFLRVRELLGSKAEYRTGDICRLSSRDLGRFDIVLFFGVLYHLKHPLRALENICEMTLNSAYIESYVTDDGSDLTTPPTLEFYEGTELRGQFDNWVGPNVACLLAMSRAAGFVEVALESVIGERAHVTCRRHWSRAHTVSNEPVLLCVENSVTQNNRFSALADDYVTLWFKTNALELTRENVFIDIGPFAASAVHVTTNGGDGWQAVCKLPPGLDSGWHDVRLRVKDSRYSCSQGIPVDLASNEREMEAESIVAAPSIQLITDGKSWERWMVNLGAGASLSLWARDIPRYCERTDIQVLLGDSSIPASYLSGINPEGLRQINAMLPASCKPGSVSVRLKCRGQISQPAEVQFRQS